MFLHVIALVSYLRKCQLASYFFEPILHPAQNISL